MSFQSMICPKCGLTQALKSECESCGSPTGKIGPARTIHSVSTPPIEIAKKVEPPENAPVTVDPIVPVDKPTFQFFFYGKGSFFFQIHLINLFLIFITVGIYYAWAKVKVRRYLFSQIEFMGDRFHFHGTGKEVFIGSIKASLILGFLYGLYSGIKFFPANSIWHGVGQGIYFLTIVLLIPVAKIGRYRYRLSRTSWREIRFSFRGHVKHFVEFYVAGIFLNLVTLGLYYPVFAAKQYAFFVSQSFFGNEKFSFDGKGQDLMWPFCKALFLTLPTLGLSWFWFFAVQKRYFLNHTTYAKGEFCSEIKGSKYCLLYVGNALLLILSIGLAYPWVIVRTNRFFSDNLTYKGVLKLETVHQEKLDASTMGEGLGNILDVDMGIGVS
ncbi:MAG: DUF898 domain-containing protein [Nitrospirae bacterium]|nr:DUF898 domain-containing protein [Nitrospirota bacterium]MBI3351312.1 DUF898 domain-containing protein [Nitrospirota bacterium]